MSVEPIHFQRFVEFLKTSRKAQIACALGAIALAGASYWYWRHTQYQVLVGRVKSLEDRVQAFWKTAAKVVLEHPGVEGWEDSSIFNMAAFESEIDNFLEEHPDPEIQSRLEVLKIRISLDGGVQEAANKTTYQGVEDLKKMDLVGQLEEYYSLLQAIASNDSNDPILMEDLKSYKVVIYQQLEDVIKNGNSSLYAPLLKLYNIGRDLGSKKDLKCEYIPAKEQVSGLAREENNSCYLATALQLFRSFPFLREIFDPQKSPRNREYSQIQTTISSMLERMDKGETIPAEEGIALQGELVRLKILDGAADGTYDAGEIAQTILNRLGFKFPRSANRIVVTDQDGNKIRDEYDPEYNLVLYPSKGEEVAKALNNVVEEKQEEVENKIKIERVLNLPDFLEVVFQGSESVTVSQASELEDPLKPYHTYKMVFAMENVGAHWIAHMQGESGWVTADDAMIKAIEHTALVRRGYYLRTRKWTWVD